MLERLRKKPSTEQVPTQVEYTPKIPRGWTYLKHGTNRVKWDTPNPCAEDTLVLTRPLSTVTKEEHERTVAEGFRGSAATYGVVAKPPEMSAEEFERRNVPFEIRVYFFENHPRSNKDRAYAATLDAETTGVIETYYFKNRQQGRHPLIPKGETLVKVGEATEHGIDVFYYVPQQFKERYESEIAGL